VVKDKINCSLNRELSKDWSKVLDKPESLSGWLVMLRKMGHCNERLGEKHDPKESAKASGGKPDRGQTLFRTREEAVREFEQLQHSKGIDAYLDRLIRLIWQTGYPDNVAKDKIDCSLNGNCLRTGPRFWTNPRICRVG